MAAPGARRGRSGGVVLPLGAARGRPHIMVMTRDRLDRSDAWERQIARELPDSRLVRCHLGTSTSSVAVLGTGRQ